MKPEELAAYKKVTEELTSREWLGRRLAEEQVKADSSVNRLIAASMTKEQVKADSSVNRLIAASMTGIRERAAVSAVAGMARHLGAYDNWTQAFEVQARSQVEELVRKMTVSAFNAERFTARYAVTEQIRSLAQIRRGIDASIIANLGRASPPESVLSLSAVLEERLRTLEQFHSVFAQTMAQTLKTAFEGLEERNKESLAKLEESIDNKIEALPLRMRESVLVRVVNALIALVTIAGVVIAFAQFLDSKEQSKLLTAFMMEATKTLQEIATNTAKQPDSYYEAKRGVKLKLRPDNRSTTLATIPRGDEVLLISKKHKWIFVAYTNDSGTIWGWVNKKYLKKSN
ncbi:MAG: SH3 domain-containing protein [Pyrinomonadaceae bacterium]|nr:SH3 domain-containing protein [Pyrinomonadaceae bacterium]